MLVWAPGAAVVSTPTLTPLDTPIFDDDIITEVEKRIDEPVTCRGCDRVAVAIARLKCCGTSGLICEWHIERARLSIADCPDVECAYCAADISRRTFDEIVALVPL